MTNKHWTSETDGDGVIWLRIDKSDGGANVLSSEVLTELNSLIEPLTRNAPRGVVIHSGKSNGFVMGADINEFTKIVREIKITRTRANDNTLETKFSIM